jgi:predicted regulator of Ras-like GTPase activity (Roadblock/LC7/MglB family)
MSAGVWQDVLREVTRIAGVRGALIVSADDGLVIAETAMDDLATADVAALSAALVSRAARCATTMHAMAPQSLHLVGERGAIFAVAGPAPIWLVAVARRDAEFGRLRLLLNDLAGALH